MLVGCEDVVSGAAKRIMDWTEAEDKHRSDTGTAAIERSFSEARRGQLLSTLISLTGIAGTVYLANGGHEEADSVLETTKQSPSEKVDRRTKPSVGSTTS